MSYPVALPSRQLGGDDRPYLPVAGGANGTVAMPSRDATGEGLGAPERFGPYPPIGGQHGPLMPVARYTPPVDWSTFGPAMRLPLATPRAWFTTHYVRHAFANVWALTRFVAPRQARTSWTDNGAEGPGAPTAPIPFSFRRQVWTLREQFDSSLQAHYYPREAIQKGVGVRRYRADTHARQVPPYFPRLTRLAPTTSYGSRTQVLAPEPAAAAAAPMTTAAGLTSSSRYQPRGGRRA